ncbi:MAG: alpha-2-macroglobulin family protein [Methylacidiphilales bacterium]|nr:alpha-2-macroglobulin family protein [Candidatus Methylacidiphilales bacterium]
MKRFLSAVTRFPRQLSRLFFAIIGDITWRPPGWALAVANGAARRPLLSASSLAGLVFLLVVGGWTLNWYLHQPKPPSVGWIINMNDAPAPGDTFQEQDLTLTFSQSVAKLESIGKDVTSGVKLSPALKGTWSWSGGSQLIFSPQEDWPAGKTFRITLSPSLFSTHVRLETLSKEFHTAPFTVAISDMMFYVDPKDPATKQITATLTFSHPVDRASLEKNLTLGLESGEQVFQDGDRVTVTYDKLDRIAYVRSSNVTVPKESEHAILTVPDSVVTTEGQAPLDSTQTAEVLVPSASDLFHIQSSSAVIATNSEGEPEQTLVVVTSVGVKTEALSAAIHAWVLPKPKSHYDSYTDKKVDVWQSAAEIDASTLAKSTPAALTAMPSEEEYATLHSFKLKVPENAWIFVKIDRGLAGLGGFILDDKFVSISQMPPYPREVHIMHDGSLLALSGERKLSIESRGVGQLEFRLARVTPASINHLVSQSEGNFQNPIFTNYNFDESNITEQIIRHQDIADNDTSRNDYSALDFSEFVNGSDANRGKLGLFILRVLGRTGDSDNGFYKTDGSILPDPAKQTAAAQSSDDDQRQDPTEGDDVLADRRLILVTDLGLLVKDNADGTHDVFVQSIKTGEPVGGAQVEVLGKNGIPVVTTETDDTGHAAVPSLQDFTREKKPVAYVVRLDDDVSFLPFGREDRELNFSRFDTAGVSGLAPHDLTAFVFTDRGIYRPGDEAKIGLLVKQRDWQGKLDGLPLRLDVVDPRGTVVQSRLLTLNASGFIESTFATRETSDTGKYEVDCYLVKGGDDETLLGSETLRVAEFLPDRMKIKATLSAASHEGWVSISGLQGLVSLQNLYGAPSVGHRVTGKVLLDPSQFTFDRYPDYTFIDPYLNPNVARKSQEQDLPDQTTDDSGSATFDLGLQNMEPSAYRLSFLAEGFEKEGGRSVTAGAEVLVSPRAWLVGVKPDGDFSYVHLGSRRSAQFLAVDSQLKPVSVEHLKMKLVERRYVSVLVQEPNGNYAYQSVLKEIPVGEEEISIPPPGLAWPLNTTRPGDFAARLYDDHGDLVADVRYSVAGAGNLTRSLDKNAELTARLSKPEYMPGEEIEVEITAPYTGSGLITIERDKVYAHAWFQAKTTSTVQKITLPKDFEGNGYLNVAFVRALDSHEIYMSPLSYTVLPFKVNQEARHTHIAIDVPQLARPGEPLEMQVSASRPTKAVVYAVDEGILQVARYKLPDPLGYFFRKQALEVGTRQTVDLILPEYSIARAVSAAGGDADEDALAHHLNPFKRKHDAPVVYWSGIVDLGPQAKTFTYNVPDYFAGTIRVMVVADTDDAVGSEQATTQVRGPFVISPNVPTVVAPGDTFDVSTTIANNVEGSGPAAQVDADLQVSDGLEVVQRPASSMTIAEGRDASLHWLLRAKEKLGNADITITAENGGKKSALVSHLSVRPPVPYLTTLTTGYFKENEKSVPVPRRLHPEFRKASALASPVPQGLVRGLGEYLEHYEYGCTEQLVSKAFPTLVTAEAMQQGLPRSEVAKRVGEILDVAATRQNDDGAFGLWYACPDLHFDLPSAHVVHFMTEAKEQGYDVPSDLMAHGLTHLQQDANGTPDNFEEARNQAYEIYLLARNGTVVTNALEHNHAWFEQHAKDDWSDDIAAVYEASAYALLKDQDQADALLNRFHLRNPKHRWPEEEVDYDDDLGRSAQYIYLLSRHFPERLKTLTQDDLMTLSYPIIDDDYNTVSSAEAILALDSYERAMKTRFGSDAVEIDQVTGGTTKKLDLTAGLYPEATFDNDADTLIFKKAPGNGEMPGLFYQITESGFDQTAVTQPISDGIEVSREYWDCDGKPVTTAKLGDELTVVVRVRSTDNQDLANVAIEDLLPGGFEIVEESVHSGRCTYGWGAIDYVDVREDRLLAFGSVMGEETEIKYRIKATNAGTYTIPPIQAEAMYHQKIRARGVSGTLTVTN